MSITGVVLYFTPLGRIARWTDWSFLAMSKDQLEAIHTTSSFVFLIAALFHIFTFNWRTFLHYFKARINALTQKVMKYRKELMTALILSVIIFMGTYYYLPPFSTLVDWGDQLKKSWAKGTEEAPVPGAEDLTLEEFSHRVLNLDTATVINYLRSQHLQVEDEKQSIEKIAHTNHISPSTLYQIMKQCLAVK